MILILAGTTEGREIVKNLAALDYNVLACATTAYGVEILQKTKAAKIIQGRLNAQALTELIKNEKVRILIDATHPFAEEVSLNAQKACDTTKILYIRYERPVYRPPTSPYLYSVADYGEAAEMAAELALKTIFLTTGTKTLSLFVNYARKYDKRIIARIVPDLQGLQKCFDLGLGAGDIIAMQGPVSFATNMALLQEYDAHVLVTKESGLIGGTGAKVEATLKLALPVIMINRPQKYLWAAHRPEQLIQQIKNEKGSVRIE